MHLLNEHEAFGVQASSDVLHDYAAGLERILIQTFNDQSLEIISIKEIFQFSFTNGGREDRLIPRRDDESYNPRCARLPQLLISEVGEIDEITIKSAMLIPLSSISLIVDAPVSDSIKSLVTEVLNVPTNKNDHLLARSVDLLLVNWIDHVRHLHISSRNREERLLMIAQAREIFQNTSELAAHPRLKTMLNHATNQQERRCIA